MLIWSQILSNFSPKYLSGLLLPFYPQAHAIIISPKSFNRSPYVSKLSLLLLPELGSDLCFIEKMGPSSTVLTSRLGQELDVFRLWGAMGCVVISP